MPTARVGDRRGVSAPTVRRVLALLPRRLLNHDRARRARAYCPYQGNDPADERPAEKKVKQEDRALVVPMASGGDYSRQEIKRRADDQESGHGPPRMIYEE